VPITSFTAIEYAHERSVAEEMLIIRQLLDQYRPKYVLATSPQLVDATANLSRSREARLVRIDSLGQGAVYVYSACMRLAPHRLPPPCE